MDERQAAERLREALWRRPRSARVRVDVKQADVKQLTGIVQHVAVSDAFAIIDNTHVPLDRVWRVRDL